MPVVIDYATNTLHAYIREDSFIKLQRPANNGSISAFSKAAFAKRHITYDYMFNM